MQKTVYIALLRGINVGGQRVKMDHLRELFTQLDFSNVRSYIQTGNVFFETTEEDVRGIQERIEDHLKTSLGYAVAVCLRTATQLQKVIDSDPFKGIALTKEKRFSIVFLRSANAEPFTIPKTSPDGAFEMIGQTSTELFVIWHLQNGRPGSVNKLIPKHIQTTSTTRFWHTTEKILKAALK